MFGPRRRGRRPGPFSFEATSLFNLTGFSAQLAAAYNICSISITEVLLVRAGKQQPTWAEDAEYLALLSGTMMGMFVLGYLGDRVGRSFAMNVALSFILVGALGSGLCTGWGSSAQSLYAPLVATRFVAGVGVGGALPLSSSVASDGSAGQHMGVRRLGMSWTYFGQSFGIVLPYVVALLAWRAGLNADLDWRIVLACGAVPSLFVFYTEGARVKQDAAPFRERQVAVKLRLSSEVMGLLCSREGVYKIIGSGGSWFLANFACNSVRTLAPTILEDIWATGDDEVEGLTKLCKQNILLASMGVPGIMAAMFALSTRSPKRILLVSTAGQFFLFMILGTVKLVSPGDDTVMLTAFCALYFMQSFGTGVCNFLVAAEMYAIEVRSTFSGISAALGQLGAIAGIVAMVDWVERYGVGVAMLLMGVVCVAVFVVTLCFIPVQNEMQHDLMGGKFVAKLWAEDNEGTTLLHADGARIDEGEPGSSLDRDHASATESMVI